MTDKHLDQDLDRGLSRWHESKPGAMHHAREAAAVIAGGGAPAVGADDTYNAPAHGWTCFHCGETFTTVGGARTHFGAQPDAVPGCMARVSLGAERGLLTALRKAEGECIKAWAAVHEETTDAHKAMYAMQGRHADALTQAEEAGYERGLRDARREIDAALAAAEAAKPQQTPELSTVSTGAKPLVMGPLRDGWFAIDDASEEEAKKWPRRSAQP
jgi:hypothetical protein